jgi:hypothetical protein
MPDYIQAFLCCEFLSLINTDSFPSLDKIFLSRNGHYFLFDRGGALIHNQSILNT